MNWPTECAAVIPCLNEQASIGSIVAAVKCLFPTTIVIDDGSQDETAAVAEQAGAEMIRHSRSQGKGAALQAGWAWAHQRGFHWALTLDGDGQHAPADIPAFLECAEQTSSDLIIGNRMQRASKMPRIRHWVNSFLSWRISKLTGQFLPDSQCGFRLMNLNAWRRLPISAAHFEIESEVLLAFARAGLRIHVVPIQVIYKSEQSKIHPIRDTIRWLRWYRAVRRYQSFDAEPPDPFGYPQKHEAR